MKYKLQGERSLDNSQDIFNLLDEVKSRGGSENLVNDSVSLFLEQKARETGTPYRGVFELTPLCNLNCKMCYVHLNEAQMQDKKLLPTETWLDLMGQAIEAGMSRAALTGGECLTYPGFDDLYLFLKSKGIMVTVKTNGVLLNAERIDFFKRNPPRAILISLYGHSDEIYEKVTGKRVFSTVSENILLAKRAKLPIGIMITPNSYMGDAVKETIRFAKELELPYFINSTLMSPRPSTQREKDDYDLPLDQYIDILLFDCALHDVMPQVCEPLAQKSGGESQYELKGIRCGAGKSSFSIRWDGSMTPCVSMDSIVSNPVAVGFTSAWRHINREMNIFPSFLKCERCSYAQSCNFCAAENEKLGSRFLLNNKWCQRTWKLVENGLVSSDRKCEEE